MRVCVVLTTCATPSPACMQALGRQSHAPSQLIGLPPDSDRLGQRWNLALHQTDVDLLVLLPEQALPLRHWLKSLVQSFESRLVAAVSSTTIDAATGELDPHHLIVDRLGQIRVERGPLWAYQHPFHQAHQTLNAHGIAFRTADLRLSVGSMLPWIAPITSSRRRADN